MSKVVRILLTIAFLIFLAGVAWTFWAMSRKEDQVTITPPPGPDTTITTSITTGQPTGVSQAPSAGVTSKPAPARKIRSVRRQNVPIEYIIVEETASASAWARSGVNPDGSTFAEAHAE